jgi:hypothetical protein
MSNFMWTFEGVMQAIGLGILTLWFLFLGLLLLIENIRRKLRKAQENG